MKKITRLSALLLAFLLLTACGAKEAANEAYAITGDTAMPEEAPAEVEAIAEAPAAAPVPMPQDSAGITTVTVSSNLAERIIYSAYAEIETMEFDASVDMVYTLMEQYDAFLENSSVNGSNLSDSYAGTVSCRSASFTLRVPRNYYSAMTSALDSVGNVTHLSSNAENITARYADTESQLKSYTLQEERLLDILAQADTVEDMIALEGRLSEIRYQKEALTSQLRNWDNQVSYSSVTLNLREVQVLTPEPQEELTYWQQVGEGFLSTIRWIGRAAKTLFRVFVAALPILLPVTAVLVILIVLCRRKRKAAKHTGFSDTSGHQEP